MSKLEACVPLAIQVVIDDVGWWSGEDSSASGGPFRTGISRDHVIEDYEAISELGKRLKMKPQAAMILCEWDRNNILQELPTSTHMRKNWNNTKWIGDWLDKTSQLLHDNQDSIEITLHGVGHEYWQENKFTRAEWHDEEGNMRPENDIRAHLEYYKLLLKENKLGPFPTSFVPTAFYHNFGLQNGLASILSEYGIRYISTPFSMMKKSKEPIGTLFGIDHGLVTIDRGRDLCRWNEIGSNPNGELRGPICGMHWPNILHQDPKQNIKVVESWINYLSNYNSRLDRMLGKNTEEAFSQVVYYELLKLISEENILTIDLRGLLTVNTPNLLNSFYIKVRGRVAVNEISNNSKISSISYDVKNDQTILQLLLVQKGEEVVIKFQ